MKNLLIGAIVLFFFSISVLILQTSCSKSTAQTPSSSAINQLNKVIYTTYDGRIFTANYDGSSPMQVNLTLPANIQVDVSYPRFSVKTSPDGQKIFFSGINISNGNLAIYSCDISGSNVTQILAGTPGLNQPDQPILCGAF